MSINIKNITTEGRNEQTRGIDQLNSLEIVRLINNEDKTYTLLTKNTMYQMKVDEIGVLEHTYYGAEMEYMDMHL